MSLLGQILSRLSTLEARIQQAFTTISSIATGEVKNPMTSTLNAAGFEITNLPAPVNPGDAATKGYTDRYGAGFGIASGAVGPFAAFTTLATLPAIDLTAAESFQIQACATFNGSVASSTVELSILVDGVPVDTAGSVELTSPGVASLSRNIQVKPAAGSRVISIGATAIGGGSAAVVAGGAFLTARRVIA